MSENQLLDQEWVDLLVKAKELGISIEEIREFIRQEKVNITKKKEVQSV